MFWSVSDTSLRVMVNRLSKVDDDTGQVLPDEHVGRLQVAVGNNGFVAGATLHSGVIHVAKSRMKEVEAIHEGAHEEVQLLLVVGVKARPVIPTDRIFNYSVIYRCKNN